MGRRDREGTLKKGVVTGRGEAPTAPPAPVRCLISWCVLTGEHSVHTNNPAGPGPEGDPPPRLTAALDEILERSGREARAISDAARVVEKAEEVVAAKGSGDLRALEAKIRELNMTLESIRRAP